MSLVSSTLLLCLALVTSASAHEPSDGPLIMSVERVIVQPLPFEWQMRITEAEVAVKSEADEAARSKLEAKVKSLKRQAAVKAGVHICGLGMSEKQRKPRFVVAKFSGSLVNSALNVKLGDFISVDHETQTAALAADEFPVKSLRKKAKPKWWVDDLLTPRPWDEPDADLTTRTNLSVVSVSAPTFSPGSPPMRVNTALGSYTVDGGSQPSFQYRVTIKNNGPNTIIAARGCIVLLDKQGLCVHRDRCVGFSLLSPGDSVELKCSFSELQVFDSATFLVCFLKV